MSQDSDAVILKIPKPIRSSGNHLHFIVETLRDAVRLGEPPHSNNGFNPGQQGISQRLGWTSNQLPEQLHQSGNESLRSLGIECLQ